MKLAARSFATLRRYSAVSQAFGTLPLQAGMAPKRKRGGDAPAQAEAAVTREPTRRRSGRNGNGKISYAEDSDSVLDSSLGRNQAKNGPGKPPVKNRRAMDKAMEELGQMEQKFATDTKMQRLAVESSDLQVDESRPTKLDYLNKQSLAGKSFVNEKDTDMPDQYETAPLDNYEAEIAEGDIVSEALPDRGARRPPAVNSDKLPLPWSGRLGYACLNTYLRTANPPVFSSRTCRIASILDHRHPLQDPSQPKHATKNRPDKSQPSDVERGMKWVQELGIANAQDIIKMVRWNDKYGIKFMRLSSEMFPFASHDEYGYKLAPFAAGVLAEAGKVIGELGHRVTTHPGQFTQIGSPRKEVVKAAIRDLDYHDEMLSLLKLPEQQNRDAVMILHMGGVYGDKGATLDRFRENYKGLSAGVKRRLVLENDDVAWSMHDLLPVCEELNIPFVLDYHHHNIIFDSSIREGTLDVMQFYDRIKKTWTKKSITQKMHYSEQTSPAITGRERRKHSPRVRTLPPCANDMDLMIEAKDKEQAVFELMRTFKLPGYHLFNNIVPNERDDESRKAVKKKKGKKATPKKKKAAKVNGDDGSLENGVEPEDDIEVPERIVSDEDHGMGGPDGRVYWPEGMEEWLKPKKKEMAKKTNGTSKPVKDEEED